MADRTSLELPPGPDRSSLDIYGPGRASMELNPLRGYAAPGLDPPPRHSRSGTNASWIAVAVLLGAFVLYATIDSAATVVDAEGQWWPPESADLLGGGGAMPNGKAPSSAVDPQEPPQPAKSEAAATSATTETAGLDRSKVGLPGSDLFVHITEVWNTLLPVSNTSLVYACRTTQDVVAAAAGDDPVNQPASHVVEAQVCQNGRGTSDSQCRRRHRWP